MKTSERSIMGWLLSILGREPHRQARLPIPGETWSYTPRDESPWPTSDKPLLVKVIDQKEGWVRYDIGQGTFQDRRMKASIFITIFEPLDLP